MLDPIKIVIKEQLETVRVYVQDFPVSALVVLTNRLALKVSTKLTALFDIQPKSDLKMGVTAKTNEWLSLKPQTNLGILASVFINSVLKYSQKSSLKLGVNTKLTLEANMPVLQNITSLKTIVKLSMLRPYKNEERGFYTWDQIISDPDLRVIEKFLWKEE